MRQSRFLVQSALLAALICVMTAFLRLPLPLPQGYVHLGDVAVLLGALMLGRRSAAAAGVGSALADLLAGFAIYAVPTAIIKGLMAFCAGALTNTKRPALYTLLVFVLCGTGMALLYLLFEWPVYGWAAALGALLPNLGQGWVSGGLAVLALPVARRVRGMMPGAFPEA